MRRASLVILLLLSSGCSVFNVPRSDPANQSEPWAAQAIRDAKENDRERMEDALEE